ncbi:MAG: hypothetical protein DMF85_15890 [Acidobacteria bacterium]|nr:MAG: hypothetical protein DMF85_15890 [Acidobacteriota bacterium]
MTAGPAPREPLWRAFERRPGRTFAAIAVLFAVAYGSSLVLLPKPDGRIVLGDAMHEYVQLRSFVFDRDLQFRNDYVRMYGLHSADEVPWVYEDTATGHVRNLMPIGPALLWTPAYLLVCAALWLFDALGGAYPLDGYGRLYQASAGFSGIAAAALGAWFSYRAAARVVEDRIAFWATLAVWLSSSAVYYSVVSPTYSHAASMFAVGVFWWAWVSTLPRQDTARYLAVGSLVGVAALMRWQDAVLLVVPATELCWRWRDGAAAFVARSAAVSAGAIAAFAPQAIVWTVLYGRPFAIPQGPDFMRWGTPALWSVIFSDNHGLVTWTPIVALALAGFVPLVRRAPLIGVAAVTFFVASWYVNACVADWWAGEAFGARRFVSCVPVFVLGLSALLQIATAPAAIARGLTVAFTAYTLLLLIQYQTFMHGLRQLAPYPRGFFDLWLARFRVPFDVLAWWLHR